MGDGEGQTKFEEHFSQLIIINIIINPVAKFKSLQLPKSRNLYYPIELSTNISYNDII